MSMFEDPIFFMEVLINGLLSGVLYSLVALGFVLIFKASGVFNFAQGSMVLFAALTFVSLLEMGWNFWIAMVVTLAVMILLAMITERVVLRPLTNQAPIILFMSTIGLNFVLEGLAQGLWGNNVHGLDGFIDEAVGIQDTPVEAITEATGLFISRFDVIAAVIAGVLVYGLSTFFTYTRMGRALRAVADDHQAAQSVGIPLQTVWAVVWAAAGIVALVAGVIWGSKLGVQFSLSLVAFKALPVLILGGFTSIPGAVIGGLIIGASEKLAEVFLPELVHDLLSFEMEGGIENWFPYMFALLFLLVRPQGLFGERIIERV